MKREEKGEKKGKTNKKEKLPETLIKNKNIPAGAVCSAPAY